MLGFEPGRQLAAVRGGRARTSPATGAIASALKPDLFDGCEVVVSHTIINQRVAPAPMETRAAAAVWGEDGRLTAWIPNQGAQGTSDGLAKLLGMEPSQVRVITPDVGGAFGAKFGADPEHAVVAWVARQLGRPARWTETRYENLIAMTHGRAQQHTITIGGSRDGDVQAYRLEIVQDAGAYPKIGAILPFLTILMTTGPYDIPKAEAVAKVVVTNTTPIGAYRGAGRPEATAAIERAMDLFATEIGVDPAEVRRKNLLPPFTEPHQTAFGALYDTGDYVAALDKALDAAGYADLRSGAGRAARQRRRPPARHRARQLRRDHRHGRRRRHATAGERHRRGAPRRHGDDPHRHLAARPGSRDRLGHAGQRGARHPGREDHAQVGRHRPDPRGRRHRRLAQPPARRRGRPAGVPGAHRGGQAARRGAAGGQRGRPGLRQEPQRVRRGGRPGRVGPADPAGRERAAAGPDGVLRAGRDLPVRHPRRRRRGRHRDRQGRRCAASSPSTTRACVLNPLLAEGQRHGGIAQGAAQAFLEEVVYDADGNPLTTSFADYPFLSATEVPSFELADMATPTTYNPLGAKGIGEAGTIGATPAVQNAIIDAVAHLGVRHIDMPATSRRVWQAIQQAPATASWIGALHERIELTVNGEKRSDEVEPRLLLVHYLREVLGLRAANVGCDTTSCGACTVLLDGKSVKSCTVLAVQADGQEVTTAEGLRADGELHPVQAAFRQNHGLQCGFCTPGMVMATVGLLAENPHPTEAAGPRGARGQPVPVHRLPQHRPRRAGCRRGRSSRRPTPR